METKKQHIRRYFTAELVDGDKSVFDLFQWKKVDVFLQDHKTDRVICDMKDLEFPEHYSQQACDIIASKYFRKAGVPTERGYEHSMRQVTDRMTSFWVEALLDEEMITEEESEILYDEIVYALLAQMFAPNSPQWFNTGLKLKYGISGGNNALFYYDQEKGEVVESKDTYTRSQASACFILSIEDKLLGPHSISEAYVTETKLFKGGSGTGSNFSNIRAEGEGLSGGGRSSGLMSFLKGLDRNAGAIKSGGTTRRAAKMVCLDVDHPEIETFISWKAKEEDKVIALSKMGYDADIDGEAYLTVSGQNSNNSIRFSDEFMKAVDSLDRKPDAKFELRGRVDKSVNREVSVSSLWKLFNQSAWRCADPAPQFDDTFNAWHTCPAGEDGDYGAKHNRINATNPCGEYAFLDDSSCNLASINVLNFYDIESRHFDVVGFTHMITLCQFVLEASIHWGQFPTEAIARKTWAFRATGLGMANLAALLMSLGLPYDSDEARQIGAALAGLITGQSYRVSAEMAKRCGAFEHYEKNKVYMQRVIRNHSRAAGVRQDDTEGLNYELPLLSHETLEDQGLAELSDQLRASWQLAEQEGELFGYRNAQVTVMAPTGTISFAMDCSSTSIEPFFSHVTYKKLSGGGFMKLVNPVVENGLLALGYTEAERKDIKDYILREDDSGMILDGKIEGAPHLKEEDLAVFDTANQCGTGERFIHYLGHVKMVAAISPLISGAISKTVNLPNDATLEDFSDVVLTSWKMGIKGITLYRDGSKFTQPLNLRLGAEERSDIPLAEMSYQQLLSYAGNTRSSLEECEEKLSHPGTHERIKPEGIRSGVTHPAQIEDVKVYITVNRDEEGKVVELFMTTDREGTLITGLLNSLSKTISVMLQYGIEPESISKMLRGQKFEPYGFVQRHPYIKYCTSVSDLISKVIDIETGDYSRVQVKPDGSEHQGTAPETPIQISMDEYIHESASEAAKNGERLYDGSTCSNCSGTRMVRNGTCKVCLDCGETTGCS
ncbi:MAG: vitamin B12-dependent ribonucleotide reductase [Eubacteriales bacterium]|nr:vitamin B12-dependent ribonucleotide reductase [Eubacteriales bacterium]MDD4540766.1 vitamin B12-dependent ribonucleotide reductase [Eubacteriales bacterium]